MPWLQIISRKGWTKLSSILRDYTPEVALARLRYSPTPAAMQGGLPRGKPASNLRSTEVTDVSQMPCRVSSDVQEWTNEGPTVPIYDPANLRKVNEQSINFHRGEQSPCTCTSACCC